MSIPASWRPWIAIICAVIAAATGVVVTVTDGGNNTISITVQGPAGPTTVVTTPEAKADAVASATHENARDESPAAAPASELDAARAQQARLAAKDRLPATLPDAAPSQAGCRSRFVRNYSSRNGVRPRLLVMHYTVSRNAPGFTDVNAITQLFNQPAFAASSNYVIDRDGNCNYIVREGDKAWTQAAGNPVSISWEIVNMGQGDGPLFSAGGLKKMARIVSDSARRWHIPIQRGSVSGCVVVRPGIIDHRTFGACGGNHNDIFPYSVSKIIAAVQAYRSEIQRKVIYPRVKNFGRKRRAWCDRLALVRLHAKRSGWTERRVTAAERYKALIGPGQWKCRFS
jgi:hypothetical protein